MLGSSASRATTAFNSGNFASRGSARRIACSRTCGDLSASAASNDSSSSAQAVETIKSQQSGARLLCPTDERREQGYRGRVLSFVQQTVRCFAMPDVGMLEQPDQLGSAGPAQPRRRPMVKAGRRNR